jgi:hypothetical protein
VIFEFLKIWSGRRDPDPGICDTGKYFLGIDPGVKTESNK